MEPSDADQVLDAEGQIVAPGFVDLHTHYDAQIQWDPYCTISGWHGVTSVVLGNCGFGFAPVRPEERDRSMLTMSPHGGDPLRFDEGRHALGLGLIPRVPRHARPHPQGRQLPLLHADRPVDDLGDGPRGGQAPPRHRRRDRRDAEAAARGDGRRRLRLVDSAARRKLRPGRLRRHADGDRHHERQRVPGAGRGAS